MMVPCEVGTLQDVQRRSACLAASSWIQLRKAAIAGRYQSKSHADLEGDPRFVIEDYGVLNASLGVHALDDRWELSLWGRNLTDEYYWSAVSSNANVVVRFPGQTRTSGASLTFKF